MSAHGIDLLDFAMADVENFALERMRRHGGVNGMFVGWRADHSRFVFGTDWRDKDVLEPVLRAMFMAEKVVCYASMSETWLVLAKPGEPLTRADMMIPPSQHPRRTEALMCAAFAKDGRHRFKAWRIIRRSDHRFRALEELHLPPGVESVAGRFAELLD